MLATTVRAQTTMNPVRLLPVTLLAGLLAACATPADPITQPVASVQSVAPVYPLAARRYGMEGTVRVRLCVLPDGAVDQVQTTQSSGSPLLDAAAIEAVKRSTFRPAQTASGRRVRSCVLVPYRFVLE